MKTFNYLNKENRPWGAFYVIHDEKNYKLKRLEVYSKQRLSYQYHSKRSEVWVIISGKAIVTKNGKVFNLEAGDSIDIPVGVKHRIENANEETLIFIEVQTGLYFGEDDIVRLNDDYKRE